MANLSTDQMAVSQKLDSLEEAHAKAEEAARVILARFPGSYFKWINTQTLRAFTQAHEPLATIHLETLQ